MGVSKDVSFLKYPKQHHWVGTRAMVYYRYDLSRGHPAEVIRMDTEEPFCTILRTDEGRILLDIECQWQPEALAVRRIDDDGESLKS